MASARRAGEGETGAARAVRVGTTARATTAPGGTPGDRPGRWQLRGAGLGGRGLARMPARGLAAPVAAAPERRRPVDVRLLVDLDALGVADGPGEALDELRGGVAGAEVDRLDALVEQHERVVALRGVGCDDDPGHGGSFRGVVCFRGSSRGI